MRPTARARLAAFLVWSGLSQLRVGELIGVHQTQVGRIMRGRPIGITAAVRLEDLTRTHEVNGAKWPEGPIECREWGTESHEGEQNEQSDAA